VDGILGLGITRFPELQNLDFDYGEFGGGELDWGGFGRAEWDDMNGLNGMTGAGSEFDLDYGALNGVTTIPDMGNMEMGKVQSFPSHSQTQTETTDSSPDYLTLSGMHTSRLLSKYTSFLTNQTPGPSMPTTTKVSPKSNSSTPKTPSPGADKVVDKIKKRTMNTLAARRYRQKRLDQVAELEAELRETRQERDALKVKCARLEGEVGVLKGLLKP
jgi:hypothetical protein